MAILTDALKEKIGTLSLDKQEKLEAEAEKAEKKAEKKAETEKKKKAVSERLNYALVAVLGACSDTDHPILPSMPYRLPKYVTEIHPSILSEYKLIGLSSLRKDHHQA